MVLRSQLKSDAKKIIKENFFGIPVLVNTIYILILSVIFFMAKTGFIILKNDFSEIYSLAINQTNFLENLKQLVNVLCSLFSWQRLYIVVALIFLYIFINLLKLGVYKFFIKSVSGVNARLQNIFYYFSNFKVFIKSIWLITNLLIKFIIYFLPLILIRIAYTFEKIYIADNLQNIFDIVFKIVFILLICLTFLIVQRYTLAHFIWAQESNITVSSCIKKSVKASKNERLKLFTLAISFALWFVLAVFIVTIPFIATYIIFSYTLYAKYLILKYEKYLQSLV